MIVLVPGIFVGRSTLSGPFPRMREKGRLSGGPISSSGFPYHFLKAVGKGAECSIKAGEQCGWWPGPS
jgi:hypothetical protein